MMQGETVTIFIEIISKQVFGLFQHILLLVVHLKTQCFGTYKICTNPFFLITEGSHIFSRLNILRILPYNADYLLQGHKSRK